jgi:ABC-type branched-subunit amino acid transport system substrate-binding protein
MLATSERDSHADEESDGHLGGLDVYVTVIDAQGDVGTEFERIVSQVEIDIMAAFGSEETLSLVGKLVEGESIVLLLPAQTPFPQSDMPAVAAFASAYENQYGSKPSTQAARGYNTARRIDVAVRAQGGGDDTELLIQSFKESANRFIRD